MSSSSMWIYTICSTFHRQGHLLESLSSQPPIMALQVPKEKRISHEVGPKSCITIHDLDHYNIKFPSKVKKEKEISTVWYIVDGLWRVNSSTYVIRKSWQVKVFASAEFQSNSRLENWQKKAAEMGP